MTEKDPFETLLDRLVASTRSPRGRFSAARSWPLLQSRLKRTSLRRTLWMRVAGAAAIVLLCVAGWQAYEQLRPVEMMTVTAQAETRSHLEPLLHADLPERLPAGGTTRSLPTGRRLLRSSEGPVASVRGRSG